MNEPMSAIGTKQTWACALHMSAYDPKRTSRPSTTCVRTYDPGERVLD